MIQYVIRFFVHYRWMNCIFDYSLSSSPEITQCRVHANDPMVMELRMGYSLEQYVSLKLHKESPYTQYFFSIPVCHLIESIDNHASVLLFSLSHIHYKESKEHIELVEKMMSIIQLNNRSIQNDIVQLFKTEMPNSLRKHLVLQVLQFIIKTLQSNEVSSVLSYGLIVCLVGICNALKANPYLYLSDSQIVVLLLKVIELTETRTSLLCTEDSQMITDAVVMLLSFLTKSDVVCQIVFTSDVINALVEQFFASTSLVKRCFYLSWMIASQLMTDLDLPRIDDVMKVLLLSLNPIVYKASIRFFVLFSDRMCQQIHQLSAEEQKSVFTLLIRSSFTSAADVITSKKGSSNRDAFTAEIKSILTRNVEITSAIQLMDFDSIQASVMNIGRHHVYLFMVAMVDWSND